MMQTLSLMRFRTVQRKYRRLQKRIRRLMDTGEIQRHTKSKRKQLFNCLARYRKQYQRLAGTAVITATTLSAQAQVFCPEVIANPFDDIVVGYSSSPQLVDVDGDGDLDLINGEWFGTIFYYENDGSNNFTQQMGITNPFDGIGVGYFSTPQLVDGDGDGDLDLIIGETDGIINYYQNDGSNNFTQQTGIANPFDGIDVGNRSSPQLVDVDGDGDLDLISGNEDGDIIYYQNDGSNNFTQQMGIANPFDGIDVGNRSSPQLVDVDGDGDLDLISGELFGTILYYENDGSNNFTQQTGISNPFDGVDVGYYSTPQLVDLDGDGDLNLISGEGFVILYYEPASTCFPENIDSYVECTNNPFDGIDVGNRSSPQLVDVDGDGDLDLIIGENNGDILYYENDGGSYIEQTGIDNPFDGINVGVYSSPQLVDVDGDGDLDLIIGEKFGAILSYENDGSNNFTEQTGIANPFDGIDVGLFSSPQLVDVDGDGDLDLIIGENYGTILYYENDGGSYIEQTGIDNPFDGIDVGYSSAPQLVDVDGDGDLDLIIGEYYGNILYYENDGFGGFIQQMGTANPFDGINVEDYSNPQLVDVDGDGDLDLIIGEEDGTIHYYKNTNLSVSASTAVCTGNNGEVELTISSSEEEGLYTISNSYSGTIGTIGVLGTTETIMTGIGTPGDYGFDVTSADGCVTVAAVVEIGVDCALPVEMLHFTAKALDTKEIKLDWATASELNNSHFLIERSRDGINFESIRKVLGSGTSAERQDYDFLDKNPYNGINYYRLKQFDYDGAFEYSEMRVVNLVGEKTVLNIFPIPAKNKLFYSVDNMDDVRAVHIFDMFGKHIMTDVNLSGELDVSGLQQGQYLLVLESENERVHRLIQKQ